MKYTRIILFIALIVEVLFISFWKLDSNLAFAIVAMGLGLFGIFQDKVKEWVFSPILKVTFRNVRTNSNGGENGMYINLTVKNVGFSTARNIKIKIRSDENKEWLCLMQPFSYKNEILEIPSLVPGEDEDFNLARIFFNTNVLEIVSNTNANNQKLKIYPGQEQNYIIKVVNEAGIDLINIKLKNDNGFLSDKFIEKL